MALNLNFLPPEIQKILNAGAATLDKIRGTYSAASQIPGTVRPPSSGNPALPPYPAAWVTGDGSTLPSGHPMATTPVATPSRTVTTAGVSSQDLIIYGVIGYLGYRFWKSRQ